MLAGSIAKWPSLAKQAYVFSLGALVSFALEFKGDSVISEELAGLLRQMMSPNVRDRPDIKMVSEVRKTERKKFTRTVVVRMYNMGESQWCIADITGVDKGPSTRILR